MERELLKFGGGASETAVHPLVALCVLIAGLLICFLPRNKAVVPFLLTAILIPMDQVLLVGPFHFMMLRILVLFGILRMFKIWRFEHSSVLVGGLNRIDVTLILLSIITAANWTLLWRNSATVIYQLGEIFTTFGTYFILRSLIREEDDVKRALRVFACIAAVCAAVMIYEHILRTNPYALLEGSRASYFGTAIERGDRFRATAGFGHPILAGTFGAVLLPLFFALWWNDRKHRAVAVLGIASATGMTIASSSSTPVLAFVAGLAALCLWPLRNAMRPIRWGILLTLISLHMVMKAPVWNLIARIDVVGGSSADHRYQLINQAILHFNDWWLVGVRDNGQWGWDMWDTANQYVALATSSGLLPLVLFLTLIVYGFKYVGRARRVATTKKQALFMWALGAALFAHVVAFFGISYFDQTIVAWYGLFAVISAAAAVRHTPKVRVPAAAVRSDLVNSIQQPAPERYLSPDFEVGGWVPNEPPRTVS